MVNFFYLFLLTFPFYFFPAGLPQFSSLFVVVLFVFFLLHDDFRGIFREVVFRRFMSLCVFVVVVNLFNAAFVYRGYVIDIMEYTAMFYYLYNLMVFAIAVYVIRHDGGEKMVLILMFSACLQFIISVFGLGYGGFRGMNYFRNPNELGYYALLVLSIYAVLQGIYRFGPLLNVIMMALMGYVEVYSASRAALIGYLMISLILVSRDLFEERVRWRKYLLIGVIPVLLGVYGSYEGFVERYDIMNARFYEDEGTSQIEERGYEKLSRHPESLLMGYGEVAPGRFDDNGLEVHSLFGNITFSYGLIGLWLLCAVIYGVVGKNVLVNMVMLSPVLVYNLYHNGIRFSLFWVLLAVLYAYKEAANEKRSGFAARLLGS